MQQKSEIVHVIGGIRPGGGPGGYLYNLHNMIKDQNTNIDVYYKKKSDDNQFGSKVSKFSSNIPGFMQVLVDVLYLIYVSFFKKIYTNEDLEYLGAAKLIIFHDMNMFRNYYRVSKRQDHSLAVMIHSPKDPVTERLDSIKDNLLKELYRKFLHYILLKRTLPLADSILLPTNYSIDGYSKEYQCVLQNLRALIVPTGMAPVKIDEKFTESKSVSEVKKITVAFFGRYNSDKGFDLYNEIADAAVGQSIEFISCGIGNIPPSKNINDLGWVTNVRERIRTVDWVVVPNRVCYFDLIILEALSLNKNILTTRVGGSRYLDDRFVTFIDIDDGQLDIAGVINSINNKMRSEEDIKDYFSTEFSVEKYLERMSNLVI